MSILLLISLFAAQNCTASDALTPEHQERLDQLKAKQAEFQTNLEKFTDKTNSWGKEVSDVEIAFANLQKRIDAAKNDGNTSL